jgi:hypothetical protein
MHDRDGGRLRPVSLDNSAANNLVSMAAELNVLGPADARLILTLAEASAELDH